MAVAVMVKKSGMSIREVRIRPEPVIHRFITVMVIPAMHKEATMLPVPHISSFTLTIALLMIGMETDTAVTVIPCMIVTGIGTLAVEATDRLSVISFPAAWQMGR